MRRILMTNITLAGRSGTETHVRDMVKEWRRRGHQVGVFTLDASGPLVPEIVAFGAQVVTDPQMLSFSPELIHGHHSITATAAIAAFPAVPALFICHAANTIYWFDRAPRLPNIVLYAAVDELCRQRVAADTGLPLEQVAVVGNAVDLELFQPRPPLPRQLRRAVLFNSTASDDTFLPAIRQACQLAGLELTVMGSAAGYLCQTPWLELPKFDVVFGKARCAMEALCCGCAVVLCGIEGVGPLVTPDNFDELRRWNFGRDCLTQPHTAQALCAALAHYDAAMADAAGQKARAALGLKAFGDAWETHYARMLDNPISAYPNPYGWAQEWLLSGRDRWTLEHEIGRLNGQLATAHAYENPVIFGLSPKTLHQIGRFHAAAAQVALVAQPGEAGYLHFGPYITARPGRYQVVFDVEATGDANQEFALLDVVSNNGMLTHAAQNLSTAGRQRITLDVAWNLPVEGLEFRMLTTGAGRVTVYGIQFGKRH